MTTNEKVFNLLESTNLNWSVVKTPLVSIDGFPTETFGIFKNGSEWLGSVGNQYVPFQNAEMAQTIVEASEAIDIETNRGGLLQGGRKVYLQAQLPNEFIGNSGIKRWITCTNSHDGSSSISFGSTNTVIVCENTFHRANREGSRFRHTMNASERVKSAMLDMKLALNADILLMENFKRMADVKLNEDMIEKVVKKLFTIDTPNQKEASTRKKNQVTAFADALRTEIGLEGATLWGLFNGITRYTNHVAAPSNEDKKTDYLMNGAGFSLSNLGFNEVMKLVEANTAAPIYIMK
jgi:phage/plasmid-like protein (TIGR03299 family)